MMDQQKTKEDLLQQLRSYSLNLNNKKEFNPGDRINYSGRVYDEEEIANLIQASLEFWLTTGHFTDEFEQGLAKYLGVKNVSLVNSGSSANLLAFMALTADELGERRIKRGDEVITVAAGFPTTIAPIVQYGAIPVFIDITLPQYNIDISMLEKARSDKTKAVMLAHTLGNPFDLNYIREFCDKNNLWLVEDNCDALGSNYLHKGEWMKTGSVGDISTCSFYPPHHITMGEGGAVCTNNQLLYRLINSYRDWGRDCWCKSGVDDTCHHRYSQQFGELPLGYDHKYVYSHFGYNLKATDLQASIGCAQLKKLPGFTKARRDNWNYLKEALCCLNEWLMLPEPIENSEPSWFGFIMTIKEHNSIKRDELAQFLEERNIQTRNLFAGNIVKHPCFDTMRKENYGYRIVGALVNTDLVMNNALWIGVYPGMNVKMLDYMVETIKEYVFTKKDRV